MQTESRKRIPILIAPILVVAIALLLGYSDKATAAPPAQQGKDEPVVLVMYDGQKEIRLSQVKKIYQHDWEGFVDICFYNDEAGGKEWCLGHVVVQPGPDFAALEASGLLPEGLTQENWPAPPNLSVESDTLEIVDDSSQIIRYSRRLDRTLLLPRSLGHPDGCLHIRWEGSADYTLVGWSDWSWEEYEYVSLPHTQVCCRAYPQEVEAIADGWRHQLIIYQPGPNLDSLTHAPIIRTYWGPWGVYMAMYISLDGGTTWTEWLADAKRFTISCPGWWTLNLSHD